MSSPDPHPSARPCRQYRFGDFTLDLEQGLLRRGAEEIALRPKAFEVLAHLVEHQGRVVTKDALMNAIWPDTEVTDNSVARCLLEIRRALADDAQQMIRTKPRRGYVFTPPVSRAVVEFPLQSAEPSSLPRAGTPTVPANRQVLRVAALAVAAGAAIGLWLNRPTVRQPKYTQMTNFTDSAVSPAISSDGRMVAFFRSENWFLTPDQIYVKLLPDGEPVQLTHDPGMKCCIAFAPDGSRIAYTTLEPGPSGWRTYTVSATGGQPSLLLSNAAGLTWLDPRHLLFSEIQTGVHMGVVTAREDRSEYRRVYFPRHKRGMAHFSYVSPDRKWVIVVEMDPVWQRCRLVPFDGSSEGRQVGPKGKCMSAAWSPDGKWMYFGAEVEGNHHLWRQRFPGSEPEQITFGTTSEEGVAIAPDGRSVVTSIGVHQSAIWIRDGRGERQLSSDGYVAPMPVYPYLSVKFSKDGKSLSYLLRRDSPAAPSELWRTNLEAGRSAPLLPGVSMAEYDLSADGTEVVFSKRPQGQAAELWLARLDRSSPPERIASGGAAWPRFGPGDQVLFQLNDGNTNHLMRIKRTDRTPSKVVPYQVGNIYAVSPDRRWIAAGVPLDDTTSVIKAIPLEEGSPRLICPLSCSVAWAPDGKFFYVGVERESRTSFGKALAIPIPPGETLPRLPASGIRGLEDARALPGARVIDGYRISPGPDPSVFAYVKTTVHRNLFRIALP